VLALIVYVRVEVARRGASSGSRANCATHADARRSRPRRRRQRPRRPSRSHRAVPSPMEARRSRRPSSVASLETRVAAPVAPVTASEPAPRASSFEIERWLGVRGAAVLGGALPRDRRLPVRAVLDRARVDHARDARDRRGRRRTRFAYACSWAAFLRKRRLTSRCQPKLEMPPSAGCKSRGLYASRP
jgi:hypothetical protein